MEGASLPPAHAALLGSDAWAQAAENDLGYFRYSIMLLLPLELAASHTSPDHPGPPSLISHPESLTNRIGGLFTGLNSS